MKTLLHDCLFDRPLGRKSVSRRALLVWADATGSVLPPTEPSLSSFDLIHLESLLVSIERGLPKLSDERVVQLSVDIDSAPELQRLLAKGAAPLARWHVAAEVHRLWRHRLQDAIASGALVPVDVLTGLAEVHAPAALSQGEQRLADLRANGGTANLVKGKWKFAGIKGLVARENGKPRSSEKTIRDDLAQAAQAEVDAARAGRVFRALP